MNQSDFIKRLSKRANQSQKVTEGFLAAFKEEVVEAVAEDGKVSLFEFGKFELKERKAREGRNPKTDEIVQIPQRNTMTFKVSEKVKEKLNEE